MQARGLPVVFRVFVVLCFGLFAATALAAATPEFAITAANVTMPASGVGSSQYAVTAIPMTGTLAVTCQYAGAATEAKIPNCTYGPIVAAPVTAGQTVTGTVYFYPYGSAVPMGLHRTGQAPAAGLALAGGLLLGLGFRRRARGRLALTVLAVGTLGGLAEISGCTGGLNGMTPGTYQYTITAGNGNPLNDLLAGASTTISGTVR